MLYVFSIFAITPLRKKELVALLRLSFCCSVVVSILYLFLRMLWIGLQCGIGVFPDVFFQITSKADKRQTDGWTKVLTNGHFVTFNW